MLKCLPSKAAHCSSLKSFFCLEQGSELQERNFIRRPTQYIPPFLGLGKEGEIKEMSEMDVSLSVDVFVPLTRLPILPSAHIHTPGVCHGHLFSVQTHLIVPYASLSVH